MFRLLFGLIMLGAVLGSTALDDDRYSSSILLMAAIGIYYAVKLVLTGSDLSLHRLAIVLGLMVFTAVLGLLDVTHLSLLLASATAGQSEKQLLVSTLRELLVTICPFVYGSLTYHVVQTSLQKQKDRQGGGR